MKRLLAFVFVCMIPALASAQVTDPREYVLRQVAGLSANDFVSVLTNIGPSLYLVGIGQQNNSGGEPRGRIFLPHAQCPNAAPREGNQLEIKLGVRQEPACWEHTVDILADAPGGGLVWAWVDRGGPAYQPLNSAPLPPPPVVTPPPVVVDNTAQLTRIEAKLDAHEAADAAERATAAEFREEVRKTWKDTLAPFFSFTGKYILPAVVAFLGGKAL